MWWRGAIVGTMIGLWIAVGVSWGPAAALLCGLLLLLASVIGFAIVLASEAIQGFGASYYERRLHGHRRR